MLQTIKEIKIDFRKLKNYKIIEEDELPLYSIFSIYDAVGVRDAIEDHFDKDPEKILNANLVPVQTIFCNSKTAVAMRKLIKDNWETFDIDIQGNKVQWKENSKYGKTKHYKKNLSKRAESALVYDAASYFPGIDETLADNVLEVRIDDGIKEEADTVNTDNDSVIVE